MTTETYQNSETNITNGFISFSVRGHRQCLEVNDFISIGRDPANGIQQDDPFLSSRHTRIERRNQGYILRDLRSRNGTFLNGARILEAHLADGDRIRVGNTEFIFTTSSEAQQKENALKSKNERWSAELARLPAISQSDMPVLLNGPSGSGKDVIAQAIHSYSKRKEAAFVSVNCSALSEALIESELFGHLRGSFTGATHDRQGAFEAARNGTLFLDEIGDLPLPLQPKLLRALENGEIRPVGSDKTIKTNVRILSATHQDLRKLVQQGRFREDLFFRLNVIRLQTPALTSRLEDFEGLLYEFARQFRVRYTHGAIAALKQHSWPGNIRELRNFVARTKAYFPSQNIEESHLADLLERPIVPQLLSEKNETGEKRSVLRELEFELIQKGLVRHHGNQRRVADELGIPKSTLHDRIRDYGIDIKNLLAEKGIY